MALFLHIRAGKCFLSERQNCVIHVADTIVQARLIIFKISFIKALSHAVEFTKHTLQGFQKNHPRDLDQVSVEGEFQASKGELRSKYKCKS